MINISAESNAIKIEGEIILGYMGTYKDSRFYNKAL